jgi:hypothetical protein
MRRPVAAAEARRSRSPSVADDVVLMEVPGRKKRGAQSLVGTIQGNLMRVPIGNFFAQIYESARDPNIPTGEPSAILATNSATKEIEDGSPQWLFINGLMNRSSSPAVRTIRIRGSENNC